MIKNYILIAWRSLVKNKLFSFINIFGLALSMSVCMIVLIRIVDSLGYNTFMKLLVLSGMIALPIGYLLSRFFLMNFVNKVSIGVLDLLACFLFLMLIGLLTILPQTWKASQENPSRNLRSE